MVHSGWSHSPLEEFEYPDEPDNDEDSDVSETITCPQCGEAIYEDTPSCPYCGHYISVSTHVWSGHSTLWIGAGIAGILAVLLSLIFVL